jgi:putative acetyltransferase
LVIRDSGLVGRVAVRPESIEDPDAIRSLTARAFAGLPYSGGTEPRIIDGLRNAKALALSLVAVLEGRIVGHVAFSEANPPGESGWFALGPVSVEPSLQRKGIGSQLIREGLAGLRGVGASGCVLVGDHRYYQRFGFSLTAALAPAGYPAEHFQILPFGTSLPATSPVFHAAFSLE